MLLKQLSDEDKRTFLCLAELLSLSDKPVLWGGKRRETIADNAKSANVTIQRDEHETRMMEDLASIAADKGGGSGILWAPVGTPLGRADIESELVARLKPLRLHEEDDPAVRVRVASEVLREILKDKKADIPSAPKLMLFELMMLALADGSISNIQWQLLDEFRHHYQLEDYIFNDLLERARTTYVETQKTLAIILE